MSSEFETTTGIKLLTLVPGFLGAALSLSYAKELTRPQAAVALLLGAAVSVYGSPLVMTWLGTGWPDSLERCIAFFLGLFAMPLVPALQDAIRNLRNLKTPWNKD